MLHRFSVYVLCLFIAVLPGCGILSPEQKASVRQTIQQEYEAGNITAPQRDASLEALDNDQPFDWTALGIIGANIALALVGGPAIVRMQRGAPTRRMQRDAPTQKIEKT